MMNDTERAALVKGLRKVAETYFNESSRGKSSYAFSCGICLAMEELAGINYYRTGLVVNPHLERGRAAFTKYSWNMHGGFEQRAWFCLLLAEQLERGEELQ